MACLIFWNRIQRTFSEIAQVAEVMHSIDQDSYHYNIATVGHRESSAVVLPVGHDGGTPCPSVRLPDAQLPPPCPNGGPCGETRSPPGTIVETGVIV